MGIVNGLIVRLAPYKKYNLLAVDHAIWSNWLEQIKNGEFRAIASTLGHDAAPEFYEATIDPSNFMGSHALHTMYFNATETGARIESGGERPHLAPAPYQRIADVVANFGAANIENAYSAGGDNEFNLLAYYLECCFPRDFQPPINAGSPQFGWEELHGDVITGGSPGALYNASYAIKREDINRAIPLICGAVADLPAAFIYTLRFVTNSRGTLAFTRFRDSVVIEIDGLSDKAPGFDDRLRGATREGALRIKSTLDEHHIDYSMHFAKLGELDAAKVNRDFGPANDPRSRIGRWRATRARLVGWNKEIFWNRALVNYGLVTPGS
jgi:hypothetical protein